MSGSSFLSPDSMGFGGKLSGLPYCMLYQSSKKDLITVGFCTRIGIYYTFGFTDKGYHNL